MGTISYEEAQKEIRLEEYRVIAEEYERIVEAGIDKEWDAIASQYDGSGVDPADDRYDTVLMLRLFKYRMRLMIICCLSETWEQDLYNYLRENGAIPSRCKNNYGVVIKKLEKFFPCISVQNYKGIREMRDLVNAIKHGESDAFAALLSSLGNTVLADSDSGVINEDGSETMFKQRRYDPSTLTSITLNVDGKIKVYYQEIVRFWNDVFEAAESKKRGEIK